MDNENVCYCDDFTCIKVVDRGGHYRFTCPACCDDSAAVAYAKIICEAYRQPRGVLYKDETYNVDTGVIPYHVHVDGTFVIVDPVHQIDWHCKDYEVDES